MVDSKFHEESEYSNEKQNKARENFLGAIFWTVVLKKNEVFFMTTQKSFEKRYN